MPSSLVPKDSKPNCQNLAQGIRRCTSSFGRLISTIFPRRGQQPVCSTSRHPVRTQPESAWEHYASASGRDFVAMPIAVRAAATPISRSGPRASRFYEMLDGYLPAIIISAPSTAAATTSSSSADPSSFDSSRPDDGASSSTPASSVSSSIRSLYGRSMILAAGRILTDIHPALREPEWYDEASWFSSNRMGRVVAPNTDDDDDDLAEHEWLSSIISTACPRVSNGQQWICCSCRQETAVEQRICSNDDCHHLRCDAVCSVLRRN